MVHRKFFRGYRELFYDFHGFKDGDGLDNELPSIKRTPLWLDELVFVNDEDMDDAQREAWCKITDSIVCVEATGLCLFKCGDLVLSGIKELWDGAPTILLFLKQDLDHVQTVLGFELPLVEMTEE